jgi:hypothetical protein
MGLFGSIAGAGLSAVGSIVGGMAQARAMRKVENNLKDQRQANQDWYDQRYNEDATQRADAQAMLTKAQESYKEHNKLAAGTAAVMGGTEESVAASKAAGNQALADSTSQIVQAAEQRKASIESQYQSKDEALQQQLNDLTMQKANNTANAVQGVANAAGKMAGAF